MNIQNILEEREKTHGDIRENAELAMAFLELAMSAPNWKKQSSVAQYTQIHEFFKHARQLTGDHTEIDHPTDRSGYATLYANNLRS